MINSENQISMSDSLVFYKKRNPRLAIKFGEKALEQSVEQNDSITIGKIYNNLGTAYRYSLEYEKSLKCFETALNIFQNLNDEKSIANSMLNIATLLMSLEQAEKALNYLMPAYNIYQKLDFAQGIAAATNNIGNNFRTLGKLDSTLYYYLVSKQASEKLGKYEDIGISFSNLALLSMDMGKFDIAEMYLDSALNIFINLEVYWEIGNTYNNKATLYKSKKNYKKAISNIDSAIIYSKIAGAKELEMDSYELLHSIYSLFGKYELAYKYSLLYDSLFKSISQNELNQKLLDFELQYRQSINLEKAEHFQQLSNEQASRLNALTFLIISISFLAFISIVLFYQKNKLSKSLDINLAEIKELDSFKGDFIHVLAHDLKNAIASYKNLTGFVKDNLDKLNQADIREMFEDMHSDVTMMNKHLDKLLLWSRIKTNSIEFTIEKNSISKIVKTVQLYREEAILSKNITIETELYDDEILSDYEFSILVLDNVIENAIKFSPVGSRIIISSEASITNNTNTIIIKDFGQGMSHDTLTNFNEIRVVKAKRGTKGEYGGGIGLVLCSNIMDKFGGRLEIQSDPNGTQVYVIFKLT